MMTIKNLLVLSMVISIAIQSADLSDVNGITGSGESRLTSKDINEKQAELLTVGFSGILWNYIRSGSSNLSEQCSQSFNHLLRSIQEGKPEAFEFLEASGRLPSKFLEGSFASYGNYERCLDFSLESTNDLGIRSHYCLASMLPEANLTGKIYPHHFDVKHNLLTKIGFCLPFACNQVEVNQIVREALKSYSWRLVEIEGCEVRLNFKEKFEQADGYQKSSILFLGTIIMIVVCSSLIQHYQQSFKTQVFESESHWMNLISVQNTWRNLVKLEDHSSETKWMDDIRLFVICIVLTLHAPFMAAIGKMAFLAESTKLIDGYAQSIHIQPLNNDWLFDGLFYAGGLMTAMSLWRKTNEKTRPSVYLKIVTRRLFLYWPVLIACIALKISLPLLGSGPTYSSITQFSSKRCQRTYWYTLFHLHNSLHYYDICVGQTWSMAAELHLYILACILVYLYKTRPRLGLAVNILTTLLGLYWIFLPFYQHNIAPRLFGSQLDLGELTKKLEKTYLPTSNHLFSYSYSILVFYFESRYSFVNSLLQGKTEKLLLALVILQAYSPAIWNIYGFKGSPMKYGLHAVAYKLISAVFYTWIAKKFKAKYPSIGRETSVKPVVSIDENQNVTEKVESTKSKSILALKMITAAARSAYFTHFSFFVWYHSRNGVIYFDSRIFTDTVYLVLLSFLVGMVFHFFVMGPFESILRSWKTKSNGKSQPKLD